MKIVFIRHLKTPGNEKRQYIGRTDEDLSEQAVEVFRQRQEKSISDLYPLVQYIISSPLKRCIQTAGLIYPGQEISVEPMLRECDFGEYEQKTYEDLKNEPEYIRWIESGGMTAFPGGEEQTSFRRRCVDGVKRWIARLFEDGATMRLSSYMEVRSWRCFPSWLRISTSSTIGKWKMAADTWPR